MTTSFLSVSESDLATMGHHLRDPEGLLMGTTFFDSIAGDNSTGATTVIAIPSSGLTADYFGNPTRFVLAPRFVTQGGQGTQAAEHHWVAARQTVDST